MISAALELLGSLAVIVAGVVVGFLGGLGNSAPVYFAGWLIGIAGVALTGYTIFNWF